MVDQDRRECDACERPAEFHLARTAEQHGVTEVVSLDACRVHTELASDYKGLGQPVDDTKRVAWLKDASKDASHEKGEQLMSPDRDGTFRVRRLTNRELHRDDRGLEQRRQSHGRSL